MKVGDLIFPVEPATYKGKEFVSALVISKRPALEFDGHGEVLVLHEDGDTDWIPMWMMRIARRNTYIEEVISESR